MNVLHEVFSGLTEVVHLREALSKTPDLYELSGVADAAKAHAAYGLSDAKSQLIVCADEVRARSFYEEYRYFKPQTFLFPAKDLLFFASDIKSSELSAQRVRVLAALCTGEPVAVVTTAEALLNRLPSLLMFEKNVLKLAPEQMHELEGLKQKLSRMGYESVYQVEAPGQFAVRGGILDVFPFTERHPLRIEFWGDEVDSIRSFDEESQKSIADKKEIVLYPATELAADPDTLRTAAEAVKADYDERYQTLRKEMKTEEAFRLKQNVEAFLEKLKNGIVDAEAESYLPYFAGEEDCLIDYFPNDCLIVLDEAKRVAERIEFSYTEFAESAMRRKESGDLVGKQSDLLMSPDRIYAAVGRHPAVSLAGLSDTGSPLKPRAHFTIRTVSVTAYNNSFSSLVADLKRYKKERFRALLLSESRTRARRLAADLADEGLSAFYSEEKEHEVHEGEIMCTTGGIHSGFSYPDAGWVFIAESDLFGEKKKRRKRKKRYDTGEKIGAFTDLNVGDYVVHENYGLGIYRGMEKIEVDHKMKDYIKISYAKGSNLYILATQLDAIGKYAAVGDKKPKLASLHSPEWGKTKARVQKAVAEVAKDLVDLYAVRQNTKGFVYGKDSLWQQEFEETFPYEETESQLLAIEDVKADMESEKIMDRLICGDVGYGKTEIALRAAFKAVQENKQVVYLVPTTILARQHYQTFTERMAGYPVTVGMLSRFRTTKQNAETAKRLKSGELDIVIGTHRVLSSDVGFRDLGLLIIDEEQRFGVTHKEKIKKLKKNVDVMSLSATPIPRTLHMSLVGIRDMSILEEAPLERTPIQTFVFEYNEEMVREAIVRELARGGQVYYVLNRIKDIAEVADRVAALVPDARVAYAHGRMSEGALEEIMSDFIDKEIDVLVATTIIEIGLDISNVNTIIIHDADNFGLSQLYQLRGRVGRSNRTAYAFLMYRRDKLLKETAEKRLAAIREFTDLGSGFKIAMRDLEIRGAGTLLGEAQSGHMEAVGYDLYCKLLGDAVKKEKGEQTAPDFETTVDIVLDAYIPKSYIENSVQKLEIYKRIASLKDEEEKSDMIDELVDRFGDPPKSVENLLFVAMLKGRAHRAYITEIKQDHQTVRLKMYAGARIDVAAIPAFLERYAPYVTFLATAKSPLFTLDYSVNNRVSHSEIPEKIMEFVSDLYESAVEK